MPCWELFEEQETAYKTQVFPKGIPVLSIEAMSTYGWDRYAHASVGLDTFGASGKAEDLFKHFGFTSDAVAKKAIVLLEFYKNRPIEWKLERPF
jgi:transketolase